MACNFAPPTKIPQQHYGLVQARVPQQLFSERFDLKLFLSLDLIHELVALQHRQTTGEVERMGDFAPDYSKLLKDSTDGVLPSGLEYTLRSCDAKGKKGMVLYSGPRSLISTSPLPAPAVRRDGASHSSDRTSFRRVSRHTSGEAPNTNRS